MFGLVLTFLKPLHTGIILYLLAIDADQWAAIGIVWLVVCDIFDGFFFRRSSLASRDSLSWMRRVSDVIGDRIAIEAVMVTMIICRDFPLYFYAVEGVRELCLLTIWLRGYHVKRPLREPNMLSRLSTLSVGLMAIAWLSYPIATVLCLMLVVAFGIPGTRRYYQITTLGAG